MLKLGQLNTLKAAHPSPYGFYLADEESGEVLLPNKYVPEGMKVGDEIEVFLYNDSEDRMVATTRKPHLMLGEYASLVATADTPYGAFFDWGLDKDLLVPHRQQEVEIFAGSRHVVYLYLDGKSNRLVGTTRISATLDREFVDLDKGDEVEILPYEANDIGISVIVNNKHQGLLYKNETFAEISKTEPTKAYVKKVRDDNKIDLFLNRPGYVGIDTNVQKLLDALAANGGSLPLTDKSPPEEIKARLGMSKGVFKKAVGYLYKNSRLLLGESEIRLTEATKDA